MLPRPPVNTVHFVNEIDVNGSRSSVGFWLFVPSVDLGDPSYWSAVIASFQSEVSGSWLNCLHSGASFLTCRLALYGTSISRIERPWAPNHGAWEGGQAQSVAMGLYVVSTNQRRGSGSRLHFPAAPDVFIDNNVSLSELGRGNLTAACSDLKAWVASLTGPIGGGVILGTVRLRTSAGPLSAAVFDPALDVVPSLRVETIRRRMPKSGSISPP